MGGIWKTDYHLLFACRFAKKVWKLSGINILWMLNGTVACKEVLLNLVMNPQNTEPDETELISLLLWSIWSARNHLVFEGKQKTAEEIVGGAQSYLLEFKRAVGASKSEMEKSTRQKQRWIPPPRNHYKINVDGAFDGDRAGAGVVIRDSDGKIMAALAAKAQSGVDAEQLELLALLRGLKVAMDLNVSSFWLETDCQTPVRRIQRGEED